MRAFGEWSPGLRAVLAVAATTLFMVLVAWATLLGPDEVFTGPGPRPTTTTDGDVHPAAGHHGRRRLDGRRDPGRTSAERFYCEARAGLRRRR